MRFINYEYEGLSKKQGKFERYLKKYAWNYNIYESTVDFYSDSYLWPIIQIKPNGKIYSFLCGEVKTMNKFLELIRLCRVG